MSLGKGSTGGDLKSITENTGQRNPITWYKSETGLYPSNVQTWWAMKRPVQATPDNLQKNYLEVFDPEMKDQITFGNTLAPRGHYLFDAFHIDRSEVSGIGGLDVETSNGARPQAIAFYAGRVFYAGTLASKWGGRIYFSQVLEKPNQVGDCFQNQDPTSEDVPDLLPTDGGVIVIPELAEVVKLYAFGEFLWVFATNGVWRIGGPEGGGFKANDYHVSKFSTVSSYGSHSFVETDKGLVWWGRSDIWALAPDQSGLNIVIQSLSDGTIKDFLDSIPDASKKYVKGSFNQKNKIVQWVYRSTAPTTVFEQYCYDKILNLDTRSGAFYPWSAVSPDVEDTLCTVGIIAVGGQAPLSEDKQVITSPESGDLEVIIEDLVGTASVISNIDPVFSDGLEVLTGFLEKIVSPLVSYRAVEHRFKYLVLVQDPEEE